MVQPNYYSFIDPYYSPFSNNLFSFYDYRWMPRSLNGIRKLAAYDPLMFFSNPYLSSYYPMMSPSLWNFHHPSFSTYGCSILNSTTYPSWIWTNNGTGGGLQNTLANHHMYFSSYVNNENSKTVVKGHRSGRGSSFNGENISDILPADRYLGRRASGITNKNIQRDINNNDPIDQSQNAYFRGRSSENINYTTRSSRSNSIQNSDRRSISNQNRTFNSRVNALNDTFSNNSLRSNRGNNISDYNSTNSGRRASYSQPSNYGNNRSGIFSSSASNNNSSSGIGSRSGNSSSSYSGRSSGFSGGSSSSGGGSSATATITVADSPTQWVKIDRLYKDGIGDDDSAGAPTGLDNAGKGAVVLSGIINAGARVNRIVPVINTDLDKTTKADVVSKINAQTSFALRYDANSQQWKVIEKLTSYCKFRYIAGDDDQAIFKETEGERLGNWTYEDWWLGQPCLCC